MSGRRSHSRFVVATQWDGAMRVLREVTVDRDGQDGLLAVCDAPGVRDEDLSLELIGDTRMLTLAVRVLGSRPIIVRGAFRHRVELAPAGGETDAGVLDAILSARDLAAVAEARRQSAAVMARWTKLTTIDLPALNAKRKAAGQPAVPWPPKN